MTPGTQTLIRKPSETPNFCHVTKTKIYHITQLTTHIVFFYYLDKWCTKCAVQYQQKRTKPLGLEHDFHTKENIIMNICCKLVWLLLFPFRDLFRNGRLSSIVLFGRKVTARYQLLNCKWASKYVPPQHSQYDHCVQPIMAKRACHNKSYLAVECVSCPQGTPIKNNC